MMMDKLRSLRKRRFYDAENSTLLRIQIPLFDPDPLMNRVIGKMRWVWSPLFVAAWVAVFAAVLGFLIHNWDLYWAGFIDLMSPAGKGPGHFIGLVAISVVVSIWHELGHGFTCKRFGGEVHDIGVMLFYFQPAFYCNIDDSYLFPKVRHRVYATFGGPYFEQMMCSVAAAVWLTTPAEWWIHEQALAVVFFTGLVAIAVNINPLIKLDGYYVLMDLLDVPNLREESFEYMGRLFRRHIFHLEVTPKHLSRRRRRIYLTYGLLAMTYTTILLTLVFVFVKDRLVEWMGPAGVPVLLALTGYMLRRRLAATARFMNHLWLDKRDFLLPWKHRAAAVATLILLAFLGSVPRFATRIDSTFTVEPVKRAVIRAPAEGIVRDVAVAEGVNVLEGKILGSLENRELATARAVAESDLARTRRELAEATQSREIAVVRARDAEVREAEGRLGRLEARIRRMTLVAPIAGVVSTSHLEEMAGRYLEEGQVFCAVDDLSTVHLDVSALESDFVEIRPGGSVRILATPWPTRPFSATVVSLNAIARPPLEPAGGRTDLVHRVNIVRVLVEVGNREGLLRPGMTGRAQFLGQPRSVIVKVVRLLHRWLGNLIW